jgi:hypothetical protein
LSTFDPLLKKQVPVTTIAKRRSAHLSKVGAAIPFDCQKEGSQHHIENIDEELANESDNKLEIFQDYSASNNLNFDSTRAIKEEPKSPSINSQVSSHLGYTGNKFLFLLSV